MSSRHFWVNGLRYYDCGQGRRYPGVTSVLDRTKSARDKAMLQNWRNRVGAEEAKRISKDAACRGTAVHAAIEAHFKGEPHELDPEYQGYWDSFGSAMAELSPEYLEHFLYSEHYRYAGTTDCLGNFEGKLSVIDFKTSGKPKQDSWINDYYLQLAAYAGAAVERGLLPGVEQGVVIIALPDQPAQVFRLEVEELREYWIQWRGRLTAFYDPTSDAYSQGVGA